MMRTMGNSPAFLEGYLNLSGALATGTLGVKNSALIALAVAEAILHGGDYLQSIVEYARRYPHAGYGGYFRKWLQAEEHAPYNSYGNGSAMRVSPVGWAFDTAEEVLREAERSAAVTHNHPEGIKGAQAVALSVFRARSGASKELR